ncbi:MAG: hypothetical protein SF029_10755 [bacterium]|nr:hypothetical protein [bacterium]
MIYEIHLYVPKTGKLTPSMLDWLFVYGQRDDQPEQYWPVRRINPKALARLLLRLDPSLQPVQGPGNDIELHYPDPQLGLLLYVHERGIILFFPYMPYGVFSRIVLGVCYTYIRYLYDAAGFWSFDPQLNVLSYADDFQSIEDTAMLMDAIMPRLLGS